MCVDVYLPPTKLESLNMAMPANSFHSDRETCIGMATALLRVLVPFALASSLWRCEHVEL